jgi:hypothetical protein
MAGRPCVSLVPERRCSRGARVVVQLANVSGRAHGADKPPGDTQLFGLSQRRALVRRRRTIGVDANTRVPRARFGF